jgi:hypothetical protein
MYQILVNSVGWDQYGGKIDSTRIFEHTDDRVSALFKNPQGLNIEMIRVLPTIFASETGSRGKQIIKFGRVANVQVANGTATISATYDSRMPAMTNQQFEKLLDELDINPFQMHRNHWSIKEINLYETLFASKASASMLRPKLFSLEDIYSPNDKLISAMMPFDGAFSKVYDVFKKCAISNSMECRRADNIWDHDVIIVDIFSLICNSRIVICDCTGRNPNVFYEVGVAHALGKDVILVTQSESDIPFDLRHIRYVKYLGNEQGLAELEMALTNRIKKIINNGE